MALIKVEMSELIEALETATDSVSGYYCISRNEFIMIDHEARRWVEDQLDINDAPEWMKAQIEHAKAIEEGYKKDYYPLPDKFDIDEYAMMNRFAHRINNVDSSREVMQAIKGRGAYRMFRKAITDHGLLDQWYGFRKQCYKELAIDWCQRYGLDYSDR